ncbi:MAG TPA: DUF433 domain-containing protein [Candidatus Bilamarchaeaceae archaeon]|nr:DUF433 domain-containing protein [Candidatus Bilamarchaeaceae archaeon]
MTEKIVIDPKICHGKPTIRGTRIMVANVLSLFAGGYDIDKILDYYPQLTRDDVRAAIKYAVENVQEEVVLA